MTNQNKLIITDVDETLLQWLPAFKKYMENNYNYNKLKINEINDWSLTDWLNCSDETLFEYINDFNVSEGFGNLTPLKYSINALTELKKLGYYIVALSSCNNINHPDISDQLRKHNLLNIFGYKIFNDIITLPLRTSKKEILCKYNPCFFIDDNYNYCLEALECNHKSLCLIQPYNKQFMGKNDNIIWAKDWVQIKEIIEWIG